MRNWLPDWLLSLDQRRQKMLVSAPPGPLRQYLSVPFVAPDSDIRQVKYTTLDFETTGLDPRKDELLSFGTVDIDCMGIILGTAQHELIKPKGRIPEASVILHEITDDQAAEGLTIEQAVTILLKRLAGKVLLAHYAHLELGFLDLACRRLYGQGFLIPAVDTLVLGRLWIERRNFLLLQSDLKLAALRKRFALPRYKTHNALSDAIATAELFLALMVQRSSAPYLPLKLFLLKY